MADLRAYLYDANLQPVGHVGVLTRLPGGSSPGAYHADLDAAIFSPWPDAVGVGVGFAVRTETAGGWRWRKPLEVVEHRLVGQPADTNLAVVVLDGPARASTFVVAGGGHVKGISSHGLRGELVSASSTFKPLLKQVDARRHLDSVRKPLGDSRSIRQQLAAPDYTLNIGGPKMLNRSLCKLLHWDAVLAPTGR